MPSLKNKDSLQYAAQLEARARDIRNRTTRQRRANDTRSKVLLGALALSYAHGLENGHRLIEAFARLPSLRAKDARFLAENLPPELAAPFAAAASPVTDEAPK